MNKIKFARIRDVKFPTRGTSNSAGMDFYIPKLDKHLAVAFNSKNSGIDFGEKGFTIKPQQSVLLPTGIKANFHEYAESIGKKLMLVVKNKSGVGSKRLLTKLAEVIDQDYQGEIFINLVNTGSAPQSFEWGCEKSIAQLILQEYLAPEMEEVSENDLWKTETERGEGSRGSTDKK